ncbi:methionine adenosyltransferase 2 subunit beta-like isoform X1 [Schistocerca piceifrons]|uniref:methionine adenosyltransferase 2 subunit beta-like isoform X1 n=1 Tax=Schistocerca piceifrons TaxID=274613 RepID=UPI001F5EEB1E|nr:methionine adenosyltransferase 2 subunit beta-like isoform X1 [Schistocerca piceifrons]
MSKEVKRVFLTGASGLLGRSVYQKFSEQNWTVFGTAFSRVQPHLHKIDLRDENTVQTVFSEFKPNVVIHTAAQRYPDKVDADPEAAVDINVRATESLAALCAKERVPLIYISTDYVFDGKNPPYSEESVPSPLNLYGKTKLQGEEACMAASSGNIVLRIPVLYGPVMHLAESAVTVLLEALLNTSKERQVSDYERRRPSHVDDIAEICLGLADRKLKGEPIHGIYHWCGKEIFTKYKMLQEMADIFHLSSSHISPAPAPLLSSSATRPYDTTLNTSRLMELNIQCHTPFRQGIKAALEPWIRENQS